MGAHCNDGPSHYHAPMPLPEHIARSPESVGVDPEKVAALFERAERDVREGRLPSAQVAEVDHIVLHQEVGVQEAQPEPAVAQG